MFNFQFEYKDALISAQEFESFGKELIVEIKRVAHARSLGYETPYASVQVPADVAMLAHVQQVIADKKKFEPKACVLIGIGGSNLGALAVHQALHGALYNERAREQQVRLYCADTVDPEMLTALLELVEGYLQRKQKVIFNVVTKSGKTTETIANFELFLHLLRRYHPHDYHEYVVVTTDAGSAFEMFARKSGYTVLTMPPKVGGRYSVFTAAGLFPLGMLGVDIAALVRGAQSMIESCLDQTIARNPAAISAIIKYAYYQQCVNIHDMFLFATDLQGIGLWYRQLLAESIGKEFNSSHQRVEIGITPMVSIGSTDLHSVGQLNLGGPRDKFTTFITVASRAVLTLPSMSEFDPFVAQIQGKPVSVIMDAIIGGTQHAYRTHKRPFCGITLPLITPEVIGQLLQFYMLEMIYLGYLFDVNPFDQPNVEAYKQETRKLLAHK